MRRSKLKLLLTACQMSFEGKTDAEIVKDLGSQVSESALSRWRKSSVWTEFEDELIQAHKQSLLGQYQGHTATLSEG